jgi:CRP-like cAMP-binding protein
MVGLKKQHFRAGEVVFHQGEATTDLYFLLSGRVSISNSQPQGNYLISVLSPGSLFGETSLLSGPPRTVTATALEATVAAVIPAQKFKKETLGLPPWALRIAQALADRLKGNQLAFGKILLNHAQQALFLTDTLPSTINLKPHELELEYFPASDLHRIHLSGSVKDDNLEVLMNKVNSLRRQKISPVILCFAGVVEIQPLAMEAVFQLASSATEATGLVKLENVQFVADRLRRHKGYQDILHTEHAPTRRVNFGENLIHQGRAGSEMFVVKTGSFTVYRMWQGREVVLWTAKPGDVIGELAMISGKSRSASVRADKSSQVYVISLEEFRQNTYHLPKWFKLLMEGLAARIQATNLKLEELLAGTLKPRPLLFTGFLKVSENFRVPGECYLMGSLDQGTIKELQAYISQRLRSGVKEFSFDMRFLSAVDRSASRYFVKFHEYLLTIRGQLRLDGAGF